MIGTFKKGQLVKGRMCELKGCKFENDIGIPEFTEPKGDFITFKNPALESIGVNPTIPNPWEKTQVRIELLTGDVSSAQTNTFCRFM